MMELFVVIFLAFILSCQTVVWSVEVNSACKFNPTGPISFGSHQTSYGTYQLKYMEPIDLSKMKSGNTDNNLKFEVKLNFTTDCLMTFSTQQAIFRSSCFNKNIFKKTF